MKRSFWLAAAAVVILCAGGGLFLYRSGFFEACASQEELRAYIAGFSPYSHLCFFIVQLLSVVLMLPGVLMLLGVQLLPVVLGMLVVPGMSVVLSGAE